MSLDQIIPQEILSVLRELTESGAFYSTMVYPALTAITTGIILYLLITQQEFIIHMAGSTIKLILNTGEYLKRQRTETEVKNIYKSLKREKAIKTETLIEMGGFALGGIIIIAILTKTLFLALVITQSMAPLIMPGDLVVTEAFTKNISVGDVIAFTPPDKDRMYVHRVTSISPEGVIRTKGDNALPDTWKLSKDNVVGKTVSINQKPIVIKGLGFYLMPINDPMIESDPNYKNIRNSIKVVQTFGPIISIIILFITLLIMRKK